MIHPGLGRYGDPLNPDGDIEAMGRIRSLLKPGYYLVLDLSTIPIAFNCLQRTNVCNRPSWS